MSTYSRNPNEMANGYTLVLNNIPAPLVRDIQEELMNDTIGRQFLLCFLTNELMKTDPIAGQRMFNLLRAEYLGDAKVIHHSAINENNNVSLNCPCLRGEKYLPIDSNPLLGLLPCEIDLNVRKYCHPYIIYPGPTIRSGYIPIDLPYDDLSIQTRYINSLKMSLNTMMCSSMHIHIPFEFILIDSSDLFSDPNNNKLIKKLSKSYIDLGGEPDEDCYDWAMQTADQIILELKYRLSNYTTYRDRILLVITWDIHNNYIILSRHIKEHLINSIRKYRNILKYNSYDNISDTYVIKYVSRQINSEKKKEKKHKTIIPIVSSHFGNYR